MNFISQQYLKHVTTNLLLIVRKITLYKPVWESDSSFPKTDRTLVTFIVSDIKSPDNRRLIKVNEG